MNDVGAASLADDTRRIRWIALGAAFIWLLAAGLDCLWPHYSDRWWRGYYGWPATIVTSTDLLIADPGAWSPSAVVVNLLVAVGGASLAGVVAHLLLGPSRPGAAILTATIIVAIGWVRFVLESAGRPADALRIGYTLFVLGQPVCVAAIYILCRARIADGVARERDAVQWGLLDMLVTMICVAAMLGAARLATSLEGWRWDDRAHGPATGALRVALALPMGMVLLAPRRDWRVPTWPVLLGRLIGVLALAIAAAVAFAEPPTGAFGRRETGHWLLPLFGDGMVCGAILTANLDRFRPRPAPSSPRHSA